MPTSQHNQAHNKLAQLLTTPEERRRILRFAVVGSLGAGVDFTVFNLLTLWLHTPAVLASVLSFCAAVSNNFLWHRYWTFADSRSKPVARQMGQFLIVNLLGVSIRTPIFILLSRFFLWGLQHLPANRLDPNWWSHNLALAGAIGIVMFWNFFINRIWTYNDV